MDGLVQSKSRAEYVELDARPEAHFDVSVPAFARGNARVTWHSGLAVNWALSKSEGRPARRASLFVKRVIDIVGASVGLALLAPLMIIVALAVKLSSPGPILFRQSREGLDGRPFEALKFRSMRVDDCDVSGIAQTRENDPRVTPVGRFIRKTSIDELPQLFNVLFGDMSLVGPRPHVAGMMAGGRPYRDLVPYYGQRLAMRPGITGWAQANGLRGSTRDMGKARERIDHDIAYIQNFSIWLDMKIIAMTIAREFFTGNGE